MLEQKVISLDLVQLGSVSEKLLTDFCEFIVVQMPSVYGKDVIGTNEKSA